jgi:hypothetical protein
MLVDTSAKLSVRSLFILLVMSIFLISHSFSGGVESARLEIFGGTIIVDTEADGEQGPYVILEYAEKNIDLIVIGTRGSSGFKKSLLGSIASSVVTYAHCLVMVMK